MSRAPLNANGMREIRIEARTINLRHKKSLELGTLVLIVEDTDEPVRNNVDVCANVLLALCAIIKSVCPIPKHGRIEFRALGNVVWFCSDKPPAQEEAIDMTLNLLRETMEVENV